MHKHSIFSDDFYNNEDDNFFPIINDEYNFLSDDDLLPLSEALSSPAGDSSDMIRNSKARKLSLLAKNFAEDLNLLVVDNTLYRYCGEFGFYQQLRYPERALIESLPTIQADQLSSRDLSEIIEFVKRIPYLQRNADAFNTDPMAINCNSGTVDLSSSLPTIRCHSCERIYSYCVNARFVPFVYNPTAPTFEHFCNSSLDGSSEKRQLLLEIIGYICSNTNAGKCALFFKGAPDSGKSIMADFICQLFGCENVANVPLHKLSDCFNIAELFGKKVNICGEVKAKQLTDISVLKMITGGDRIQGEFKNKDPFTFRPQCKLLFSGNALPGTREADSTSAFANRLVVLLFNTTIPKEAQDKLLGEKLWEERDAIFSLAVEAFQSLANRNFIFTLPADSAAFLRTFRYSQNSIKAFIEDCCILDPDAAIFNCTILSSYEQFCHANGFEIRPRQQLYDALDALPGVAARRLRKGNENRHGRVGIKLVSFDGTLEQAQQTAEPQALSCSTILHSNKMSGECNPSSDMSTYYSKEGKKDE